MSRSPFGRRVSPGVALSVMFLLSSPLIEAQTASADARLRALYTEEWNWRQKELARNGDQPGDAGDHPPAPPPR